MRSVSDAMRCFDTSAKRVNDAKRSGRGRSSDCKPLQSKFS